MSAKQALLDVDDEYVETWYLLALLAFNKKEYHEAKRCPNSRLQKVILHKMILQTGK